MRLNQEERQACETMIKLCETMLSGKDEISFNCTEVRLLSHTFNTAMGGRFAPNKTEQKKKKLSIKQGKDFTINYDYNNKGHVRTARCTPRFCLKSEDPFF